MNDPKRYCPVAQIGCAHADRNTAVISTLVDVGPGYSTSSNGICADFGFDAGVDGSQW